MPHPPSLHPHRGTPTQRHPHPRRSLAVVPSLSTSSHEHRSARPRAGATRAPVLRGRAPSRTARILACSLRGHKGAPSPCPNPSILLPCPGFSSPEEPRLPVSTGTHQYPPARRCSNRAVATSSWAQVSTASGYSPHAAKGAMISLGSRSGPVKLQVLSEKPGTLGVGIGDNVDQHPADTPFFALLSALGTGLPDLSSTRCLAW